MLILQGGPLAESTHGDFKFTAPLTAITAAVTGVILNLVVFFNYHILRPQGLHGGFERVPATIGIATLIALFRFKAGVIPAIAACGLAGLAYRLLL